MAATNLYQKLKAAKLKFPDIEKRGVNPFFKSDAHPKGAPYILYEDIVSRIRPVLLEEGLDFRHSSRFTETRYFVGTYLIDLDTGDKTEPFEMPLAYDPNAQKQSAGVTYAKRVTATSELALAGDTDDDGNAAVNQKSGAQKAKETLTQGANYGHGNSSNPGFQTTTTSTQQQPKKEFVMTPERAVKPVSPAQISRLWTIAAKAGWTEEEVKQFAYGEFHIDSITKLNMGDYQTLCSYVEEGRT